MNGSPHHKKLFDRSCPLVAPHGVISPLLSKALEKKHKIDTQTINAKVIAKLFILSWTPELELLEAN